jgi:hypothetical protein
MLRFLPASDLERYSGLFRVSASQHTQPKSGSVLNDLVPKSTLRFLASFDPVCKTQTFLPLSVPSASLHQWHVVHRWLTTDCIETSLLPVLMFTSSFRLGESERSKDRGEG